MSETVYDLTIVGAGIAGASLAWQLAPHASVLLLEREAMPGMHSTGRSAAMFMESYGPAQVRALTRASRSFYEQPPAGFALTPILAPRGALYAAWQGQQAALETLLHELRGSGAVVERIDAAQALHRVPVLREAGLLGALAEPEAMDIDVNTLHQGYLRGARRQGCELWCNAELHAARNHRAADGAAGGWIVELADGRHAVCRSLVNAAGAWADEVAQRCGVQRLGLQPKRRSAFTFAAPAGVDTHAWPAVADVEEHWYFKPEAGVLLGSPANADPVAAHDVVPEEIDIATGIAGIEAATTLTIRRPQRVWAGLRTFAPDGELVVGWDSQRTPFFWLAGQGGYGIQSAAAVAELAAALWLGAALPDSLREVQVHAVAPLRLAQRPRY